MQIIAETTRLIIREFLPREEDIYLDHFNDEEVCLYIPKRSREGRSLIFRTFLANYGSNKQTGLWGIFYKIDDKLIGSCLLRPYNNEPGKIELGYSIDKEYWGKGIGTEMAAAMVEHGLSDANITAIVAVTELPNIASQRVLEKAGFKPMGNFIKDGEELAYFSVSR